MMSVRNLGYLGLRAIDLESWDAFAVNILGLMRAEGASANKHYRADSQAWRISVERGDKNDIAFLGFEVADAEELAKVEKQLRAADVAVFHNDHHLAKDRGVTDLISCHDPEGLPVEIYYGATQVTEKPFVSPAGVSGFVTGLQGIGHVVLATADIAKARAFYCDVLGFKLSDYIRMKPAPNFVIDMEFYHCNPRHHTLALVPAPAPRRMHHFMLQAKTIDDVGFALDRAEKAGIPIASGLGRHTNDQMISFYAQTPAEFEVEFGFGAIEVEEATWRVTRHDSVSSWGHKRPKASH